MQVPVNLSLPHSIRFTESQVNYLSVLSVKYSLPLSDIVRRIISSYIEDNDQNPILLFPENRNPKTLASQTSENQP